MSRKGLTFVELLIVTAMLAVVSFAIYAIFSNGVKVWHKVNAPMPEEDVNILFDKFASDVRNCFKYTGIAFIGNGEGFECASLVFSPRLQKRTVGKIIYVFDSGENAITRETRDYSGVYTEERSVLIQMTKNIKSVRFYYYMYDAEKSEYLWLNEWLSEGLPLAVRMELECGDDNRTETFTKTVSIPVSK